MIGKPASTGVAPTSTDISSLVQLRLLKELHKLNKKGSDSDSDSDHSGGDKHSSAFCSSVFCTGRRMRSQIRKGEDPEAGDDGDEGKKPGVKNKI